MGTYPEHGYSVSSDRLYQDIVDLRARVKSLEDENSQLREKLFFVDKLKNDDSAVSFDTGFPYFHTLMDVFSYLLPKLEHIPHLRGSDKTVSTEKVSKKLVILKTWPKVKANTA